MIRFVTTLLFASLVATATTNAQTHAERIGWFVSWPDQARASDSVRRAVEDRAARLLEESNRASQSWSLIREELPELAAAVGNTPVQFSQLPVWRDRFDQVLAVSVTQSGTCWRVEARSLTAWPSGASTPERAAACNANLLAHAIADVVRRASVPSICVQSLDGERLRAETPIANVGTRSAGAGETFPRDTVFRIVIEQREADRRLYRTLAHAFARFPFDGASGQQLSAELVAAASETRAIRRALESHETVRLVPVRARPGVVRLRAVDRDSGKPLPDVELYAARGEYSTDSRRLIGVTSATGEPIDLVDLDGGLWYVSLKTGSAVYELPVLVTDADQTVDVPISAGEASAIADDIQYLVEDFNYGLDRYRRALHRADSDAEAGRFDQAYAEYRRALQVGPDVKRLARLAEEAVVRSGDHGRPAKGAREAVIAFIDQVRRRCAECETEVNGRLELLKKTQENNALVSRAEELERQALRARAAYDIDSALRLYAAAIELLPSDVPYRRVLEKEQKALDEAWRIRGGDRQREARRFVFEELVSLSADGAVAQLSRIENHVSSLIEFGDRFTLLKAHDELRAVFDRVIAAAREIPEAGGVARARTLSATAKSISHLLDRIGETLRSDS